MTQLVNNVQLIGRAGLAPEIKTFEKDRKLARFWTRHYRVLL